MCQLTELFQVFAHKQTNQQTLAKTYTSLAEVKYWAQDHQYHTLDHIFKAVGRKICKSKNIRNKKLPLKSTFSPIALIVSPTHLA